MIRNAVTKVATNKIFYVTISIIISTLLWLYVVNVVNKNIEATITGIAVEYLGEDDILLDRNLLVSEDDRQTVSLTILGKRSVVTGLNRDNIKISVDLTKVKNPGVVERYYEITLPENISERDYQIKAQSPAIVSVNIVRLVSEIVSVKGTFIGTVEEGYLRQPMEFSPDTIKVSGPEAVVSQIADAEVVIERENLSDTVVTELGFTLRDKAGKPVVMDDITTDTETIEVRLPILQVKEVVLTVDLVPGGGVEKENTQVVIDPPTIELSGDPELLETINTISIGTIDLSKVTDTFSQTYPIPIPNNVENVYQVTDAKVALEIIGLATKRMLITKIEKINLAEGYTVAIPTQTLILTIRGPADQVALVETHNIRVVVDLSEFSQYVGLTSIEPEIYVDGFPLVGVIKDYTKVTVSIAKEVAEP